MLELLNVLAENKNHQAFIELVENTKRSIVELVGSNNIDQAEKVISALKDQLYKVKQDNPNFVGHVAHLLPPNSDPVIAYANEHNIASLIASERIQVNHLFTDEHLYKIIGLVSKVDDQSLIELFFDQLMENEFFHREKSNHILYCAAKAVSNPNLDVSFLSEIIKKFTEFNLNLKVSNCDLIALADRGLGDAVICSLKNTAVLLSRANSDLDDQKYLENNKRLIEMLYLPVANPKDLIRIVETFDSLVIYDKWLLERMLPTDEFVDDLSFYIENQHDKTIKHYLGAILRSADQSAFAEKPLFKRLGKILEYVLTHEVPNNWSCKDILIETARELGIYNSEDNQSLNFVKALLKRSRYADKLLASDLSL